MQKHTAYARSPVDLPESRGAGGAVQESAVVLYQSSVTRCSSQVFLHAISANCPPNHPRCAASAAHSP